MARSQIQDVIRCQYCENEPAVFHCVPCGDELCPRCKVFHLKSKVPSGHNIVRLSERLHPANQIKMCEVHSSKAYEICCKVCQVPVCIMCIQEVHSEHAIGKIQDLYEKLKAETIEELTTIKTQLKSEISQRIKDYIMGEKGIKTSHEDIREKMKKQAQIFINDISAILAEALQESEKDERKYIVEIARHTAEAENFEQTLDQMIEKWETLTDSTHPVELILYRKQNPDIFKLLKLPNKLSIVMPSFSVGQINKSQNKHQFGKLITSKVNLIKSPVESSKHIQPTMSAKGNKSKKRVLERSVKTSQIKAEKRKLCYMACRDDRSAYISGDGPGIQLIDRSGTELDNISTDGEPIGLAVMLDRSLIYSEYDNKVIYKVALNKQKTEIISTEHNPGGLCCTKSGDILVCMGYRGTARVVRYNSTGRKIQEIQTDQNGERHFSDPFFICENVNKDICVSEWNFLKSKLVVLNKSGNLHFTYDGHVIASILKDRFQPSGVATDSLGHILIADRANNAVHLISQDGDFLSYILTENDGISRPYGISVDRHDNLWLVEQEKACVKVYRYL